MIDEKYLDKMGESIDYVLNHIEELISKHEDSNHGSLYEALVYIKASRITYKGHLDLIHKRVKKEEK